MYSYLATVVRIATKSFTWYYDSTIIDENDKLRKVIVRVLVPEVANVMLSGT